jgi:hypothetical protein
MGGGGDGRDGGGSGGALRGGSGCAAPGENIVLRDWKKSWLVGCLGRAGVGVPKSGKFWTRALDPAFASCLA